MKRIILISIIFFAIGTSCKKDFLVKDPLDQVTNASLSFSANECKLYVNQFYTSFLDFSDPSLNYVRVNKYNADQGTDNLFGVYYNNNADLVDLHIVPASGGGWSTGEWGNIRSVNFLLDNYVKSKEQEQAGKYVAEARFFRAYFYFQQFLTKFGGVPWIGHELATNSSEFTAPRMERSALADSIIADMDWAIAILPSFSDQEQGRVSKEVAELYKARVALYEGTWEKYHAGTDYAGKGDPSEYLKIARDASKAVISSGLFSLDNMGEPDGYFKLFSASSYYGSKEVMLWKEYSRTLGVQRDGTSDDFGGGVGLTRRLVDSYLCTDGKPISESGLYQGDDNLLKVIQNRDPRLSQTMYVPGKPMVILDGTDTVKVFTKPDINFSVDYRRNSTGYELCKGMINYYTKSEYSNIATQGLIAGADIIFRYAEALLIYAEARVELGEITQADLDITVNVLRDRVGMPHLTVGVGYNDPNGDFTTTRGYTGVAVSNLLAEIRRERRVELACEGFRMDDLKRWAAYNLWNHDKIQGVKTGQFKDLIWLADYFNATRVPQGVIDIYGSFDDFMTSVVKKWNPSCTDGVNYYTDDEGYNNPYQPYIPGGHFSFDPNKDYLAPIPTQELLLNENLEQNPGW